MRRWLIGLVLLVGSSQAQAEQPLMDRVFVRMGVTEAGELADWAFEQAQRGRIKLPDYMEIREGRLHHKPTGEAYFSHFNLVVEVLGARCVEGMPQDGPSVLTMVPLRVYNMWMQDRAKETFHLVPLAQDGPKDQPSRPLP